MKFFGIDTEILGNNNALYYILKHLKFLETNYKLFIPPEYKEKFYFRYLENPLN